MAYVWRGPLCPEEMLIILFLTGCFSYDAMRTQETHELVWSCTEVVWIWAQCLKNELIFLFTGQNLLVLVMHSMRKIITSQFSTRKLKAQCFKASVALQKAHRYRKRGLPIVFMKRDEKRYFFSDMTKFRNDYLKQQQTPQTSEIIQTYTNIRHSGLPVPTTVVDVNGIFPQIWLKKGLFCSEVWHSMICSNSLKNKWETHFLSDMMARLPREPACQLLSVIPLGGLQNILAVASLEASRSTAGHGSGLSRQGCWRASSPAETAEVVLATKRFFLLTFFPCIITPQCVR